MQTEPSFETLCHRYLEGRLGDSDYDLFTRQLHDSGNLARFDEIKRHWKPERNPAAEAGWQHLSYRMAKAESPSTRKTSFKLNYWLSAVAAVLLVGLFISTTIFYLKSESLLFGYTRIETPRGEKSKVTLPDGTEVWLNANSSISYPSFSKSTREVKLEGEAYFNVQHSNNIPFVVHTARCDVKVLGTEFNVMAYERLNRNEVTLFKGRIEVKSGEQSAVLKVGELCHISDEGQQISKANLNLAHSWVENKLNFQKIPFSELIMRLENWYDVDIDYDRNRLGNTEFSGSFKNEETIWQVLDALKVYMPINYKIIDNRKIELNVD